MGGVFPGQFPLALRIAALVSEHLVRPLLDRQSHWIVTVCRAEHRVDNQQLVLHPTCAEFCAGSFSFQERDPIGHRAGAHQQCASPAIGETDGGRARERRLADTALPCEEVEPNRMFDKVTQAAGHCGQYGTRRLALRITIDAQQLRGSDQGCPEEERLGNGFKGRSLYIDGSAL